MWKGHSKESVIKRKKRKSVSKCMRADQKSRQDAPGPRIAMLPPASRISLIGMASGPPNRFVRGPIHEYPGFSKEVIEKGFASRSEGQQLTTDARCHNQAASPHT